LEGRAGYSIGKNGTRGEREGIKDLDGAGVDIAVVCMELYLGPNYIEY
jgi:hypothetical protein